MPSACMRRIWLRRARTSGCPLAWSNLGICGYSLLRRLAGGVDLGRSDFGRTNSETCRRGRPGSAPTPGRIRFSSAACCGSFAPGMISIRTGPLSWRNLQTAFRRRRSGSRYIVQRGSRGSRTRASQSISIAKRSRRSCHHSTRFQGSAADEKADGDCQQLGVVRAEMRPFMRDDQFLLVGRQSCQPTRDDNIRT